MASLEQMLSVAGTIERAEIIARDLIEKHGPSYLLDLELLCSTQGRHKEAEELNRKALKENPDDHRALYNKGWDLIRNGDLLEGYRHLRYGRQIGVYAKPDIKTDKPIWNGKDSVYGKTVLFHCECGLGDEIIHIRFVRDLVDLGANVVVGCSAHLMSVFSRVSGVSAVVDKDISGRVYHDYWVPSMNAVDIIGVTYDTIKGVPYLFANPEHIAMWKTHITPSDNIKVGIRWAGNICYEQELFRTIPAMELVDACTMPGVDLYSLQRDDNRITLPGHVKDLGDMLETWEDTAGAMANLDLVISSCTSIPHFSAALGRPTWVVVSTAPYYQWALPGDKTPWYNSVTLFRQEKFQDWSKPLNDVTKALHDKVESGMRH